MLGYRSYKTQYHGDHVKIYKRCSITGEEYSVSVDREPYDQWQNGQLIQEAFPDLTIQQREFMISGNTPAEWEHLFG